MPGEFDSMKDSHSTKLEQRPQIFVNLSLESSVVQLLTLISGSRASAVTNMDLKYFTKHLNVYVFCLQTHKNLQGKNGKGSPPRDYSKHLCLSQFLPGKLSFIGSVYFG